MTDTTASSARSLAVGERHLAMLAELGDIAMAVSRAYGASAIASAEATDMILKDDYFVPEVGRARACGAKDAAESFQKVTRALRLTLLMEKQTVEWMEGRRSGKPAAAGETQVVFEAEPAAARSPVSRDRNRESATDADVARHEYEHDRESLVEADSAEVLARPIFRQAVDDLCADLGATADWTSWTVGRPISDGETSWRSLAEPLEPGSSSAGPHQGSYADDRWVTVPP